MKKSIVTILAVAIIGALGVYGKNHPTSAGPAFQSSSVQSASTNGQPAAAKSSTGNSSNSPSSGSLKDGSYTGVSEDTPYGTVQIAVVVSGGKVSDVNFLQMPNDRGHTQEVTALSEPLLRQETVGKQNSQISFISGATSTSEGYQMSLQSALNQAA